MVGRVPFFGYIRTTINENTEVCHDCEFRRTALDSRSLPNSSRELEVAQYHIMTVNPNFQPPISPKMSSNMLLL
jgi:hypothetical protein